VEPAVQICNALSKVFVSTFFRDGYSPKAMRRNMNLISGYPLALLKRRSSTTVVESINIDGVPAELITTRPDQEKIMLLLHGGGYFMGSLRSFRRISWHLSDICNVKVLLVDYRLAPENPYPAGLEDAKKAYRYLKTHFPKAAVIVAGDSAGAGLALALTLSLRDSGDQLPEQVVAISPWADLTLAGKSVAQNQKKDFWLSETSLKQWSAHYYAQSNPKDPYISPVFANYKNFPPLIIFTGDQEILSSDSERLYELAKEAGVKVEMHVGKDMQHDWFLAFPFLKESRKAIQALQKFIGG
jgi:monoterpene epsilon-lactone hydrolase